MQLTNPRNAPIISPRDPELPTEVTTKRYVDTNLNSHSEDNNYHLTKEERDYINGLVVSNTEINHLKGVSGDLKTMLEERLLLSGGSLTGPLLLHGTPTQEKEATTKEYVDSLTNERLSVSGGSLTGPLTLVRDPVNAVEAATKRYVDTSIVNHNNESGIHLTNLQQLLLGRLSGLESDINTLSGITGNVQEQLDQKLDLMGGSMLGTLYTYRTPRDEMEVVNKSYVDNQVLILKRYLKRLDFWNRLGNIY